MESVKIQHTWVPYIEPTLEEIQEWGRQEEVAYIQEHEARCAHCGHREMFHWSRSEDEGEGDEDTKENCIVGSCWCRKFEG